MKLKRFFDFTASAVGLLLLSPVLSVVAVWIRVTMGSPVFFRQRRPGLNGKPFWMLKFRTMNNKRDENGDLLPDEERLTRLGRFLRKTSLDEFPELINVLKGEMSLVGPRPLVMEYLPYYSKEQFRRHEVLPGITGLAQIAGRVRLPWEERFRLDVRYVDERSFFMDTAILVKTVLIVFSRKDSVENAYAIMDSFDVYSEKKRSAAAEATPETMPATVSFPPPYSEAG